MQARQDGQRWPRQRGSPPGPGRVRPPWRGCAVAAVAWLLLAGTAPAAAQRGSAAGDGVEVLSVSFEGARQVPPALLRTAIETMATTCVSAALQPLCWAGLSLDRHYLDLRALAADVFRLRVFYYHRGFREAAIELDTVRVDGGMHVRFRVQEGRPTLVRSLAVEGGGEVDEALRRSLPLRPGEPFSTAGFEMTRDTLTARLADRGFASAYVLANYDIPDDGSYAVDLLYQLDAGPVTHFGAVEITGLRRVAPAVVERMLTFREGDLFSRQALLRSQRNLFGLEVFRHAEIATIRVSDADSILPVRIQVNEGDMHRVRMGVGMSTSDYLNAEGRWISRNLLGGGRRLELRGRVTNMVAEPLSGVPPFVGCAEIYCGVAGSLSADFSQPWFFGPANALGTGLFVERFSLPGVYVRTSQGAYTSLARAVVRGGRLTLQYRMERTQLQSDGDLIFCINFIACEEAEIDQLRDPHLLAPVGLSFVLDRSNSLFAPTRGYVLRFDGEIAGTPTASDFAYSRFLAEATTYYEPVRGVVLATRLRPGAARVWDGDGTGPGLHPQKRFFAGGPNSVRGFAQYRLGPRLLTVNAAGTLAQPEGVPGRPGAGCTAQSINDGSCDISQFVLDFPGELVVQPVGGAVSLEGNLEARFPVWADRLRGAAFLDFGQVWRRHDDASLADLRFTPGLGVRYFSPVGPVRIDVGYNSGIAERLPVMTTEVCHARVTPCGAIEPGVTYDPAELANRRDLRGLPSVMYRPDASFLDRLQFHFSIGQAF
jgi:outer membrane protein assembly factor BamA